MNAPSLQPDTLTKKIIVEATAVHRALGPGLLESIYHHALLVRLKALGLKVGSQEPLPVFLNGEMVADFLAEIIVEDGLIVELEVVPALQARHETHLINCLAAAKIETGLLLNFGARNLEYKRKSRTSTAAQRRETPELAVP